MPRKKPDIDRIFHALSDPTRRAMLEKLSENPLEMVFIRAPIIESVGKGVEVLAEDAGHPVLVREGKIMASTFHPELTTDSTVHEYFLKLVRNGS